MKVALGIVGVLIVAAGAVSVVHLQADPEPQVGPVQTSLAELIRYCPGVEEMTEARWRFWRLGKPGWAPEMGPDDYAIEALVTLPAQSAYTLRWSHQWKPTAAPLMNVQLVSQAPKGVWLIAAAEPCPGYGGPVYLLDGSSVVYFSLSTQ